MDEAARLGELADAFHAAALSPGLWPTALRRLSDDVGGGAGVFLGFEGHDRAGEPIGSARLDPAAVAAYRLRFGPVGANAARPAVAALAPGAVMHRRAFIEDAFWEHSDFYQHLLRPWDLYHAIVAPVVQETGGFAMLTALRPRRAEDFGAADQARLSTALRHLGHALRVAFRLGALEARATAAEAALDRLAVGVALLDAAGSVLRTNAALRAILADADGLMIGRSGALVGARPAETAALARVVAAAAGAASGPWSPRGGAVALARPSGSRPLSVLASPLAPEAALGSPPPFPVTPGATVLLLVSDPERRHEPPASLLSRLHGLSPSQSELVLHLLAGLDLKGAAEAMGITANTAKTLLGRAFLATGTAKQSELLALVLRGPAGVVGTPALG